ncbi:MAG: hypothetical protein ACK5P7_12810 [Bdellovibrio sp.]|jgi:hypothetical protein
MRSTRVSTYAAALMMLLGSQQALAQFDWFGRALRPQPRWQPQVVVPQEDDFQTEREDRDGQEDPSKSKDPRVYCSTFDRKEVTVDGQTQFRYEISDAKYLRCLPAQPAAPWKVQKTEWSQQDELNWQNFVKAIGESKCNTFDTCIVSEANPYRDEIDRAATHYSDCADFPMSMRAYFAFKNKLPFSTVFGFQPNPLTLEQEENVAKRRQQETAKGNLEKFEESLRDIRYSLNGNRPTSRSSVPHSIAATRDYYKMIRQIQDVVSSGTFRMFHTNGDIQSDFYSPAITRDSIRPGTVLYKVTGHVALVYDVTDEGEVKFIDAHPDNSITRGVFSRDYVRSNPFQGGGFKNWRPFKVTNAKTARDGSLISGRFVYKTDDEIADLSAEQYYGSEPAADWDWKKGQFSHLGKSVNYYEFIERRLADPAYRVNPVQKFRDKMIGLCTDIQERTRSVQLAIDNNLHTRAHPTNLPRNIYGADGEWESYSTPGRDLRIRKRTLDVIDDAKDFMAKVIAKDPFYVYEGDNLKRDLIKAYHDVDASCRVSYLNSQRTEVRMSLTTALARLTKMSFDPYFCPERRWGARSQAELRTCVETTDKAQWYEFTQFLRNQVVRDPTEVMGYSLGDAQRLNQAQTRDGKDQTSRFNIRRALEAL